MQRVAVSADRRRGQPPHRSDLPIRKLILAGLGVLPALAIGVGLLLANQGLPGLQSGPPPWSPETAHLGARLGAIGLSALRSEGQVQHTHQHLDLYIDGQPVTVPIDIGVNRAAGFLAPIHTHDATGIIHMESPIVRDFTLGEFFDVWGVRFDAHCIAGECDGNGRTMSVFLNGQPFAGDPRSLVLAAHQEIVVALGSLAQLAKPIPAAYAFPTGL
jgi:hypothetical protein